MSICKLNIYWCIVDNMTIIIWFALILFLFIIYINFIVHYIADLVRLAHWWLEIFPLILILAWENLSGTQMWFYSYLNGHQLTEFFKLVLRTLGSDCDSLEILVTQSSRLSFQMLKTYLETWSQSFWTSLYSFFLWHSYFKNSDKNKPVS